MFTNDWRQEERTGKYGTSRLQYLQELVVQFQNSTDEETKEKIVANFANFSYDPYNYTFLRQPNGLELFLGCVTLVWNLVLEESATLVWIQLMLQL
ncbi:Armadillo repeat-containing 7 [Quillaja saponaria]|uniref:Armadillo repeat-containing 7 n=1 Tax=Quillaja saponaria TaxID=32244 RepID=A0AAD7LUA1_QUISA|nr:Armadillo repeat-containing 7 [Quillaja saponaria]